MCFPLLLFPTSLKNMFYNYLIFSMVALSLHIFQKYLFSLEETDVIVFLYDIFLSFRETAESKEMEFKFIPSVSSYPMFVDKGKLDKIVYNLLSNAFKYTPEGGKIVCSVDVEEETKN